MSNHFAKYQTQNESNIPIPKRTQTGIKKSKRCAQLPELQRYIETIIKASNECDSEDTSISERDKFPKDRKLGKYSVFKGFSSKITQDKINYDFNLTRSKTYNKSKTPNADAVSRDDKIYNKYVREFEDPRNWKLHKNVCLGPKPEIEKFLKKFYPNPYHLESIYEFKGETDDLRDVTLPDVISKTKTEVDIEKTDIVPADKDIETCRRASKSKLITSSPSSEKNDISQSGNEDVRLRCEDVNTTSAPTLTKNPGTPKTNNSTSNTSSKVSSLESIHTFLRKESTLALKNRKNQKSKTKFKSIEKNDYDIGKLKLLSATDSDEALRTKSNFKNLQISKPNREREEEVAEQSDLLTNSELIEFGNMNEIYKIINQATESILSVESKDNKTIRLASKLFDNSTLSIFYSGTQQDNGQFRTENFKLKNTTSDNNSVICRSPQNLVSDASENNTSVKKLCGNGKAVQETSEEEEPGCEASNPEQNIDEVVDFIYECLKKFGTKEKTENPSHDMDQLDKSTLQCINEKPTTSHVVLDIKAQPSPMRKSSSEGMATPKPRQNTEHRVTQLTRLKCKRQRGTLRQNLMEESDMEETPLPPHPQMPNQRISEIINLEPRGGALHRNNENPSIATAESQNELGGFTEEPQMVEESKSPKSSLPLPVKLKSIEINTCKTLINALEEQERQIRRKGSDLKEDLNLILKNEFVIVKPPSVTTFREIEHFKQDIVIKNSIPQRIQSMKYIEPNLELPLNIEAAPNQLKRSEFEVIKLSIGNESWCRVTKRVYDYRREEIVTAISDRPSIAYTLLPICEKAVFCISKTTEGPPKTPSNQLRIFVKVLEPSNIPSALEISESSSTTKNSSEILNNISITSTQTPRETTDTLSQKNTSEEKILYWSSPTLTAVETKEKSSQSEIENENYRKKVHELLLRAYSLEQKLQKCLEIMTCLESTPSSNMSLQEKTISDVRSTLHNKFTLQINTPPVVHWHLKPSEYNENQKLDNTTEDHGNKTVDHSSTTIDHGSTTIDHDSTTIDHGSTTIDHGSTTVDHGTTYDPPENEVQEEPVKDVEQETERKQSTAGNQNEDDNGNLSDSSFKSSVDTSEVSEPQKLQKEKLSKKRFSKKVFSQTESYTESVTSKIDIRKDEDESKPPDPLTNNQLTHYDSKTPAKVLKTVFKGKKSMTELTIGLKDVQMTKVGNISVEKTKYSPNHTKISICISRKNSENKFPPYVFDPVRSSISSCLADLSRIKGTMSKTSQSNGDSDEENDEEDEEDEEDYKSVASTLSHTDDEDEKPIPEAQKPPEVPRLKNSPKHRFDFYRKMNLDMQSNKSKRNSITSSVCRYKELEPLKQALTEMQIRMRSIKKDALFSSNEYYERALRLAKMSAGFCQSCGNRAVIPNDTFGYYRSLLPGKSTQSSKLQHFKTTIAPKSSFYALPLTRGEVKHQASDLGLRKTPCSFHTAVHTNRTILRSPLRDMPIVFEGV